MSTATVTYAGVRLACTYDYTPGSDQTWTDPGYPACAEVSSVKVGGVEILDMLSNEQIEAIDTLIQESFADEAEAHAAEEYHRQRDERAMEGFLS